MRLAAPFWRLLILGACALALFAASPAQADCTGPAAPEGKIIYNLDYNLPQVCTGTQWMALGKLNPSAGGSGCSGPTGVEGQVIYNRDAHVPQYCDGDDWRAMIGFAPAQSGGNCPAWFDTADLCPDGFFAGGNGSCYRLVTGDWSSARTACQALGADLTVIEDSAEHDLLRAQSTQAWIGYSDTASEGNYVWVNGAPASYTGWGSGEPNNGGGNENCAELTSGGWNDAFCTNLQAAICEIPGGVNPPCDDFVPFAFSFTESSSVALSTQVESNIVKVLGVSGDVPVSVSGGGAEYRICSDATCASEVQTWGSAGGTIQNSQYIQLRLTSSASYSTAVSATVTVGGATDQWDVITGIDCAAAGGDSVGGGCWFLGTLGQSCTTVCAGQSLIYTATGQNYAVDPNVANCQGVLDAISAPGSGAPVQSTCGGNARGCSYTTGSGGQRRLCATTDAASSSGTYQRACACGAGTAPAAFSFTDEIYAALSTLTTSNSVTIVGIVAPVNVSVTGGGSPQIRINGGSWVTSGTIANGQTLEVRLTSSASNSALLSATVTAGVVSDQWDVMTVPSGGGCGVSSANLAAYWKLDESSGATTAADSSGNNNNGTLTNMDPATDWVAGKVGGALDLDDTDDYVTAPDSASLDVTTGTLTMTAWIYKNSLSGDDVLFGKGPYTFETTGDELGLYHCNAGCTWVTSSTANLTTGAWYHVAVVYNDAANTTTFYSNGAAVGTVSDGASLSVDNSPMTLSANWNERIDGRLDEVRIYSRALTSTEMLQLYNGGAGCAD